MLANELVASIDTWVTVRDDEEAPASARLQAADRIVERILGRVRNCWSGTWNVAR
jgi:hypothetical protein